MSKQVKFIDLDGGGEYGGILLDNGDLICGECGGLFKASERCETWDIVKVYDTWVNLSAEITGDD